MNQVGTNTDTEIYNNPQGLSASFLSPFHTHREISLTYAQKHASLRLRHSTWTIFFLPSSYAQNSVCEIDNPQGPDAQHIARPYAINSMAKEPKKDQIYSMDTLYLNQPTVH